MPISSSIKSGPPGLTLKAWALVNPTAGGIVRGAGFATFTRSAAGTYAATFDTALSDAFFVVDSRIECTSGNQLLGQVSSKVVGGFSFNTFNVGVGPADGAGLYVAVYA